MCIHTFVDIAIHIYIYIYIYIYIRERERNTTHICADPLLRCLADYSKHDASVKGGGMS